MFTTAKLVSQSLHQSPHKIADSILLLLLPVLSVRSEVKGNYNRHKIQRNLHQSE